MFWCTGDSTVATIRVPICTPSAPSANAAAMERPSAMPPAAIIGRPTRLAMRGSSTIDVTSRGFLNPAPSLPSTTSPSTPESTALSAPLSDGTTWKTVSPAAFRVLVCFSGEPAEVVTKRMPSSTIMSMIRMSCTKAIGRFTPNGLSVRSRVRRMSSRTSSIPSEPGTRPIAPALATAETSAGFAMKPIGA
ncbi:unannotated protein [freshwater metagenome]|uniref:Unannotated protein n=1 Tax=freshwater metagenome TaxID=449393 RepID=A0A6J6ZZV5_9ZZZZ